VPDLARIVAPGDEIFLADGAIVLTVRSTDGNEVLTEIVRGGILRSRKGMHFLAAERFFEPLTDRDLAAISSAAELGVQLLGLSFIRTGPDVRKLRAALPAGYSPFIVAKIETRAAVENLDEVIREADAVMVARGDLGIQLPLEYVPEIQRSVIEACNRAATPVITATQLLESMTSSPLPTRAEVTDVANAVKEGTDAVMLSEETAVGAHPVTVVETMVRIIRAAERSPAMRIGPVHEGPVDDPVSWAVAHAAMLAADDVDATAILCPTRTGGTPRRVAAFRPKADIVALSSETGGIGPLCLTWGVHPFEMDAINEDGLVVERSIARALEAGVVSSGDRVVVVSGSIGRVGGTDLMQVVEI
jgi:pyruvate kinase